MHYSTIVQDFPQDGPITCVEMTKKDLLRKGFQVIRISCINKVKYTADEKTQESDERKSFQNDR